MIDRAFIGIMASYNAEMNRRIYEAARGLPDEERRRERGAFWGSIYGTLCHLLWADQIWMSRFDGWSKPSGSMKESAKLFDSFAELQTARFDVDARISAWAERIDEQWLDQDLTWFSGAAGRELCKPRKLLVVHFFNHQTHHRGQAHAMLTAAGQPTADTDLFVIV